MGRWVMLGSRSTHARAAECGDTVCVCVCVCVCACVSFVSVDQHAGDAFDKTRVGLSRGERTIRSCLHIQPHRGSCCTRPWRLSAPRCSAAHCRRVRTSHTAPGSLSGCWCRSKDPCSPPVCILWSSREGHLCRCKAHPRLCCCRRRLQIKRCIRVWSQSTLSHVCTNVASNSTGGDGRSRVPHKATPHEKIFAVPGPDPGVCVLADAPVPPVSLARPPMPTPPGSPPFLTPPGSPPLPFVPPPPTLPPPLVGGQALHITGHSALILSPWSGS